MRNTTFKNRLRFLTLKQLVCLLEFSLKNVVLSANSDLRDLPRQEESPNSSYRQPKDCSKVD